MWERAGDVRDIRLLGACLSLSHTQELTRGEMGILHSNVKAWELALARGWEWELIIEDDAMFEPLSEDAAAWSRRHDGSVAALKEAQLLARHRFLDALPMLVESATEACPEWELIVLSPVNTPYDFFR